MTDEKLDQILKQALAPEIDDAEIQIRRKVRNNRMNLKKIISGSLVACAAFAIVMVGGNFSRGSEVGENVVSNVDAEHNIANANLFAITAYAAELPEGIHSGDVIGLRMIEADYGSPSYLNGRFSISGHNIEKVNVTTNICNLYTSIPVYSRDPDYEQALTSTQSSHENYEPIYKGDPEKDGHIEYYDHCEIVGRSYEGEYDSQMSFGLSVPKELWSTNEDPKKGFWEDVDQVDGATLTIGVTFTDGSTETHHYTINTGKIFVPVSPDGTLQWDNLTRFLTEDEKDSVPFTYGYLIDKMD